MSSSKSRTLDSLIAKLSDPAYQINRLAGMIHEDADRHGLWDDFREAMRRFEDREDSARLSAMRYYATGVVSGEVSEMRSAHEDKAHMPRRWRTCSSRCCPRRKSCALISAERSSGRWRSTRRGRGSTGRMENENPHSL